MKDWDYDFSCGWIADGLKEGCFSKIGDTQYYGDPYIPYSPETPDIFLPLISLLAVLLIMSLWRKV